MYVGLIYVRPTCMRSTPNVSWLYNYCTHVCCANNAIHLVILRKALNTILHKTLSTILFDKTKLKLINKGPVY
jgi:hypothetical protein